METLYTSHEEHGSVAEIHSLLSLQPVFPSKLQWLTYEIQAELEDVASCQRSRNWPNWALIKKDTASASTAVVRKLPTPLCFSGSPD
jgi:hypothetical protein